MKSSFIIFLFAILINLYTDAQTMTHTELLGRPTDHSITVQVFFDSPVEACIQYGTVSGIYPNQTTWLSFAAGDPVELLVDGLAADTKYYYRLCFRPPGAILFTTRPTYSFHTQRSEGSSFSFVIQADPHMDEQSDSALYRICLKNQLSDGPDFMIDLGDILMTDKLKNTEGKITHDTITYRSHLLRSYYETECHSVPLFISLGNHEGESGWNLNGTSENVAIWGTLDRKKYFLNPSPGNFYSGDTSFHKFVGQRENYYSWQWGDAQFIVIDPYWYTSPKPDSLNGWRWTLGKTQYDWLRATLENSKAKFKFVFAHQIIGGDPNGRGGVEYANRYEWGGNNLDGTSGFAKFRPGWYKPIKDLLTENRVTIFFHGHDHFFGKQEKDCLIYQETPQPSHPNFQNANQAQAYGYFEGQILPNSGHIRVTVNPDGIKVDYVRAYKPINETATRHNKDVSATYFIGDVNCYDSLSTGVPIIWNSNYSDELIYPNPFVKDTKIEFTLSKADHLNISIFNESGLMVRRLVAGNLIPEGSFEIIWDGKDGNGSLLPAGVYFYAIQGDHSGLKIDRIVKLN